MAQDAGGDTAAEEADTAAVRPPSPAWIRLGNTQVRATHVVLEAAVTRSGATAPSGLSLTSRGWPAVGLQGALATIAGVRGLDDLEYDSSADVDGETWSDGQLVPADPCLLVEIVWRLPDEDVLDVGLGLAPINGRNCDVDGTLRPPLLGVGFGSGGAVSFSRDLLSMTVGDPAARCTVRAFDIDEETLSREVSCSLSLGWHDGAGDAVPGAARLADARLMVGVVEGAESLVGQP
ncbi:MAG: hypothetical protein VX265_03315 [Myxococcota bacterium]|nr:hypothetical protein [Myxococcota bacterium]